MEEDYDEHKDIRLTRVQIVSERGAREMGKPMGNYLTLEAPGMASPDEDYHREISETLACYLKELMGEEKERSILVARSWKPGCDTGCSGTQNGIKSSDYQTSDQRIWKRGHGNREVLSGQRDRSWSHGTDRDGDIRDHTGNRGTDKTGPSDCN